MFADNALWASLILGFDADRRVALITTADPSELTASGGSEAVAKELVGWVSRKYSPCCLELFMDLDDARALLTGQDKRATLRDMARKGRLVADPLPEPLARLLAVS